MNRYMDYYLWITRTIEQLVILLNIIPNLYILYYYWNIAYYSTTINYFTIIWVITQPTNLYANYFILLYVHFIIYLFVLNCVY